MDERQIVTQRQPRRSSGPRLSFAVIPVAILILAAVNLSLPYYSMSPGPAHDVRPLISVTGTDVFADGSPILMTTVKLRSVTLGYAAVSLFNPAVQLLRREAFTQGRDDAELDRITAQQMEDSKLVAAAAALDHLGHPVRITGSGARVEEVHPGLPSDGVLEPGDVIVGVDGAGIAGVEDLVTRVTQRRAGSMHALRVLRAGEELQIQVRSAPAPDDPDRPVIGVTVLTHEQRLELPFGVEIRSGGIGGPSAGLMFAVAVVDLLDGPGSIAGDHVVAGTGVIAFDGSVGNVGGVRQKVTAAERAGATVFLVPYREYEMARSVAGDIEVVGVRSLQEALDALGRLSSPVSAAGAGRAD